MSEGIIAYLAVSSLISCLSAFWFAMHDVPIRGSVLVFLLWPTMAVLGVIGFVSYIEHRYKGLL